MSDTEWKWVDGVSKYKIDIPIPNQSDWRCKMAGESLVLTPAKGDEPNWFNRLMQRLILGFVWEKR